MTVEEEVKSIVINELKGVEDPYLWFRDFEENGCASGMVSAMIYYRDTVAFFERHKEEITDLASYIFKELNWFPVEAKEDPCCVYDTTKNWYAWFAFEETVKYIEFEILEEIEEEEKDDDE